MDRDEVRGGALGASQKVVRSQGKLFLAADRTMGSTKSCLEAAKVKEKEEQLKLIDLTRFKKKKKAKPDGHTIIMAKLKMRGKKVQKGRATSVYSRSEC